MLKDNAMDELIFSLLELTRKQMERMEHVEPEEWAEYVEARESILLRIRQHMEIHPEVVTTKHRETVREILACDQRIMQKMTAVKGQLQEEMDRMKQTRTQMKKYETFVPESVFFDQKR